MSFFFVEFAYCIYTHTHTHKSDDVENLSFTKKKESNQGSHILSRITHTFLSLVPLIIFHDIFSSARTHQTHTHKHFATDFILHIFLTKLDLKQIFIYSEYEQFYERKKK